MLFAKKKIIYFILSLMLFSCSSENPLSNLFPQAVDLRTQTQNMGIQIGDTVPDFTLYRTDGTTDTLLHILTLKKGVVLYFTMWCPICETHMDYIRLQTKPLHPDVEFYFIDYVSGTIANALDSQTAGGYSTMNVALDNNFSLTDLFNGTMGTTIVIDRNSILKMNEDFKNGQRLSDVLNALP